MKILAIESSCDETAAAVVENGTRLLSNEIASQVEIHARYGGVVPEVASRQHLLSIIPVIRQAMDKAGTGWTDIDGIAVTNGPGLAGSLLVGVNAAKAVALTRKLPLIGVNHIEAHIYANWLEGDEPKFPLVCLIVSGGHTDLVLMQGHGSYTRLGGTRDDAAGEAFDKAARLLGLGYPGGPAIDREATNGSDCVELPRAWLAGSDDFSFSGIKTSLYRLVESGTSAGLADLCASFQNAVIDVLVKKTINASLAHEAREILLSGGVAANRVLRRRMTEESPLTVKCPSPRLCTDNAAMVAAAGYFHLAAGQRSGLDLDILPDNKLY